MLKRGFGIAELRECPWFWITKPRLLNFASLGEDHGLVTPDANIDPVTPGDDLELVTRGEDHGFVTPDANIDPVTPGEDPRSRALANHGSRIKSGMTVRDRFRIDGLRASPA